MKTRYNKDELWTKVKELAGITIVSLTKNKLHKISKVNNGNQTYVVEYASGNQELVSLDELYALYEELYRTKSLSSNYMKTNVSRILGWKHWHAPGSAMMAHIKLIDDHVLNDGATLYLKKNNESGLDYPIHKTPVWNKPTDSTDHQHLVESFTNTSLTEYFCNREKTRIALDSYLVFIAKKGSSAKSVKT